MTTQDRLAGVWYASASGSEADVPAFVSAPFVVMHPSEPVMVSESIQYLAAVDLISCAGEVLANRREQREPIWGAEGGEAPGTV